MSIRVSNQIFNNVTRALPKIFAIGGAYLGPVGTALAVASIGTDTPASFGGVDRSMDKDIAMGRVGEDNSVSLIMKEAVAVSLWVWEGSCTDATHPQGRWVPGGGVVTEYSKTPTVAYGKIGFWVPKSTLFFLSAASSVTDSWVNAARHDGTFKYTGEQS